MVLMIENMVPKNASKENTLQMPARMARFMKILFCPGEKVLIFLKCWMKLGISDTSRTRGGLSKMFSVASGNRVLSVS